MDSIFIYYYNSENQSLRAHLIFFSIGLHFGERFEMKACLKRKMLNRKVLTNFETDRFNNDNYNTEKKRGQLKERELARCLLSECSTYAFIPVLHKERNARGLICCSVARRQAMHDCKQHELLVNQFDVRRFFCERNRHFFPCHASRTLYPDG